MTILNFLEDFELKCQDIIYWSKFVYFFIIILIGSLVSYFILILK